MTARKGDMVTINRVDDDTKVVTVKSGIVIKTRKKEVTRTKNKYVMEVVIASTADVLWNSGELENNIPTELLEVVNRAK
tara:strand:- start:40 stop:276 length:237 start_codon:yes stop_codon:yes gene_type:complete